MPNQMSNTMQQWWVTKDGEITLFVAKNDQDAEEYATDLYGRGCEWGEFCSLNDRRDEERVEQSDEQSETKDRDGENKDEPKIVEKEEKMLIADLPEDMTKLITSYVKPKSYSEMTERELWQTKHKIEEVLEEKSQINEDDSSDKYMVILAEFWGPETYFKLDKAKYSKDLKDYRVFRGKLYYKGEEMEVQKAEDENYTEEPKEISWYDFDNCDFFDDEE